MRVSIVTVCYNAGATIAATLQSVAAQTYADLEHIVIDGASSDDTLAVVEHYRRPALRVVSERDRGIYDAMNKGLAAATGEFILFLNADDFLARDDAIDLAMACQRRTGADCILGSTLFVDPDGVRRGGRHYSVRGFAPWWLRIGVMPPHPSFLARTSLLRSLGGFDERFRMAADFDLAARALLGAGASYAVLPEILTCFRTGGLTTSGSHVRHTLSREFATSLSALGQSFAPACVRLRFLWKLRQYVPIRGIESRLPLHSTGENR